MSEARVDAEWLAAELAAEDAEDAAIEAELVAEPDPFDDDFVPSDPHERILHGAVSGELPTTLAEALGVRVDEVGDLMRAALDREAASPMTAAHIYALVEASITDVTRRAYIGLGQSMPGERSDLLNVLLGAHRLRLDALAQRERCGS